jgi:5-methylcytosine-specific restriction endonuclease McrA
MLKLSLSTKTKANSCLFCGDILHSPTKCQYCGFKFCEDHMSTDNHQCGKTRYAEYVRKTSVGDVPNLASGMFAVVCDTCGYRSAKGLLIEFAGEELIQHMQIIGCATNVFLEEVGDSPQFNSQTIETKSNEQKVVQSIAPLDNSQENGSIVDQLTKLASLKEKGVLSNEEFLFIKKEIIKKLQ